MKIAHMMLDEDRSHRLCDGENIKLPLPRNAEDWAVCERCEKKAEALRLANENQRFGLGVSFAQT